MNAFVQRYSDPELEEFRILIDQKLERAKEQLELLQSQIREISETDEGDSGRGPINDRFSNTDVEMINSLAIHQRKYIRELEGAMARIGNKTYGVCEITGDLIDKKRLTVAPTTTKSLAAKLGIASGAHPEQGEEITRAPNTISQPTPTGRQVIAEVLRKLPKKAGSQGPLKEEQDFLLHQGWPGQEDQKEEGDREITHYSME